MTCKVAYDEGELIKSSRFMLEDLQLVIDRHGAEHRNLPRFWPPAKDLIIISEREFPEHVSIQLGTDGIQPVDIIALDWILEEMNEAQ